MFLWLKERELTRSLKKQDAYIRELRAQHRPESDITDAHYEWLDAIAPLSEEIQVEKTERIRRRAEKYDLWPPDGEGHLTNGLYPDVSYLTAKGRHFLRAEIRREKRERREELVWLIPLVFGIIGAMTGLISVWQH
jgi:hypothetical protein